MQNQREDDGTHGSTATGGSSATGESTAIGASTATLQWEYRTLGRETHGGYWTIELGQELADLGREGWELVTVYPAEQHQRTSSPAESTLVVFRLIFVFKRAIQLS